MSDTAPRSRSPAKRAAIVAAARALFFERGIEATTIEAVAQKAGVSKVTIYGHFGDKDTLLEAVVRAQAAEMEQALIGPQAQGRPLPDILNGFGYALLGFITSPDIDRCERLLVMEAPRHPELARRFYEAGPGHMRARVARVLEAAGGFDDPAQAAEDLIGLWQGMWPVERKLGLARPLSPAELRARVERGTARFLRAYA